MANKNIKVSDLNPADFVSFSQRELSQEELSMAGGSGSGLYTKDIQITFKTVDVNAFTKPLLLKAAAITSKAVLIGTALEQKATKITSVFNKYH